MTIAVLLKVVPELEEISYDPVKRTMKREGVAMVINPFDWRALMLSFTLRRPGERVVVVSMGPPDIRPTLLECLALGADEVVHVCDKALSGSDTFVTAKVLAAALSQVGPDLILAGKSSIDSSTGQVVSQLASLLNRPLVDEALKATWADEGHLSVVTEDDVWEESFRAPLRSIVAVGEKIAKVRHASPEELEAARSKKYTTVDLSQISIDPRDAGSSGSLTDVLDLADEAPVRHPLVISQEPPMEATRAAATRVAQLLSARELRPLTAGPEMEISDSGPETKEIIVFATDRHGSFDPKALGLLSGMLAAGDRLWASVVMVGELHPQDAEFLKTHGVSKCYVSESLEKRVSPEDAAMSVLNLISLRKSAAAVLFLSDAWSREVAGRVSGSARLGLVGDAVGFEGVGNGALHFKKPSFGGGLIATVVSKTRPAIATMRHGTFEAHPVSRQARDLSRVEIPFARGNTTLELVGERRIVDDRFGDLDAAQVVVGVGMGIGSQGNIPAILNTVAPLDAALGATRRVVDAGWLPHRLQIGMTGQFVSPTLYIAVGAKGKMTHMVGVKRAKVIVGINLNPSDPLFEHVDVGLVGRWEDLLGPLVEALVNAGISRL